MKKKILISLLAGIPDDADIQFNFFGVYPEENKMDLYAKMPDMFFNGMDYRTDDDGNICSVSLNFIEE